MAHGASYRTGTSRAPRGRSPAVNRREFVAAGRRRAVRRCARALGAPCRRRSSRATPRRGSRSSTCGAFRVVRLDRDARRIRARSSSSATCGRLPHRGRRRVDRRPHVACVTCCAGFVEPRYTAAHPDGVHAFVTDSGRSGVVVDRRACAASSSAASSLPGWARHLTIDRRRDARSGSGLGSASRARRGASTSRRCGTSRRSTPGFGAHDVGFAPDGRLWVTAGATSASSPSARARARGRPGAAARHVRQRGART